MIITVTGFSNTTLRFNFLYVLKTQELPGYLLLNITPRFCRVCPVGPTVGSVNTVICLITSCLCILDKK